MGKFTNFHNFNAKISPSHTFTYLMYHPEKIENFTNFSNPKQCAQWLKHLFHQCYLTERVFEKMCQKGGIDKAIMILKMVLKIQKNGGWLRSNGTESRMSAGGVFLSIARNGSILTLVEKRAIFSKRNWCEEMRYELDTGQDFVLQ